jgi:hypothetical protein
MAARLDWEFDPDAEDSVSHVLSPRLRDDPDLTQEDLEQLLKEHKARMDEPEYPF